MTRGRRDDSGLGPIGGIPERQGQRIGSALMHALLGAADAMEMPMVALLGDPDYYQRFGFVAASDVNVEPPTVESGKLYQVMTLSAHRPELTGRFAYAPPFDSVSPG